MNILGAITESSVSSSTSSSPSSSSSFSASSPTIKPLPPPSTSSSSTSTVPSTFRTNGLKFISNFSKALSLPIDVSFPFSSSSTLYSSPSSSGEDSLYGPSAASAYNATSNNRKKQLSRLNKYVSLLEQAIGENKNILSSSDSKRQSSLSSLNQSIQRHLYCYCMKEVSILEQCRLIQGQLIDNGDLVAKLNIIGLKDKLASINALIDILNGANNPSDPVGEHFFLSPKDICLENKETVRLLNERKELEIKWKELREEYNIACKQSEREEGIDRVARVNQIVQLFIDYYNGKFYIQFQQNLSLQYEFSRFLFDQRTKEGLLIEKWFDLLSSHQSTNNKSLTHSFIHHFLVKFELGFMRDYSITGDKRCWIRLLIQRILFPRLSPTLKYINHMEMAEKQENWDIQIQWLRAVDQNQLGIAKPFQCTVQQIKEERRKEKLREKENGGRVTESISSPSSPSLPPSSPPPSSSLSASTSPSVSATPPSSSITQKITDILHFDKISGYLPVPSNPLRPKISSTPHIFPSSQTEDDLFNKLFADVEKEKEQQEHSTNNNIPLTTDFTSPTDSSSSLPSSSSASSPSLSTISTEDIFQSLLDPTPHLGSIPKRQSVVLKDNMDNGSISILPSSLPDDVLPPLGDISDSSFHSAPLSPINLDDPFGLFGDSSTSPSSSSTATTNSNNVKELNKLNDFKSSQRSHPQHLKELFGSPFSPPPPSPPLPLSSPHPSDPSSIPQPIFDTETNEEGDHATDSFFSSSSSSSLNRQYLPYGECIECLEDLNNLHSPLDQLMCLLALSKLIYATAQSVSRMNGQTKAADLGADSFFPIFLYIIIHANVEDIHNKLLLMQVYTEGLQLGGELAEFFYYLTCFEGAVHFISTAGPDQF